MEFSALLLLLGDPGRYQSLVYLLLWLCNSLVAMNHLIMGIYGSAPKHMCSLPSGVFANTSIPIEVKEQKSVMSSCKIYSNFNASSGTTTSCPKGWTYTFGPNGGKTIVSEWDLVCDDKYLSSLATTVYFAGVMVGGVLFGIISDLFGRRPVLLGTLYGHILLGVAIAIMPFYIGFVVLRFALGMLMQGLQSSSYIIMIEMTPMKNRTSVGGLFEVFWAVGTIWMASIAWVLKDWRWIQLALCLPSVITILYWWIIPESARWLLINGKKKEALSIVLKIAKHNKVKLPDDIEVHVSTAITVKQHGKITALDIIKEKVLRLRSLVMFYIWMATAVGYYGLSLNATRLAGNRYLNFFISGCLELPAFVMCIWILRRFGRRLPLLLFLVIGGVTCIISGTVPKSTDSGKNISMLSTTFALIGKYFTAAAFAAIFLFTSELFPTSVRNAAMGGCTFWARAGGMVAPQILLLGDYTFRELPILIFGCLLLVGAGSAYVLPETKGKRLPDTVEEMKEAMTQEVDYEEMETTST